MLQPSKVKWRKIQKGKRRGMAQRGSSLAFGDMGIMATECGWITARQIEASRVAITRHLTGQGKTREEAPQSLGWSDFLVLCRSRTHIATYEQALREASIPIVPAGRGMLARSREVRDILVLLRWLTYPEDHGLPSSNVQVIATGPDDEVWAYLVWEGVYRFDGASWQKVEGAGGPVFDIAFAADGQTAEIRHASDNSVVDTVGAGDAFTSVIILGLMRDWPLALTLERAQAFASAVVGVRGATVQERAFYQPFIGQWELPA